MILMSLQLMETYLLMVKLKNKLFFYFGDITVNNIYEKTSLGDLLKEGINTIFKNKKKEAVIK